MKITTVIVAAALLSAATAGCGGGSGHAAQIAGCKAAMRHDYQKALANPAASPATEPAVCKGLDAKTLRRLAGQVMAGALLSPAPSRSTTSSAFPVYKKGSSQYEALLACVFDAGYRHTSVSQADETLTMRGASVPPVTFKVDPAARTITPANARTEVVLHAAGCPGAF